MVNQVGWGKTIYCAILIATYNGGGGAMKGVLKPTNRIT